MTRFNNDLIYQVTNSILYQKEKTVDLLRLICLYEHKGSRQKFIFLNSSSGLFNTYPFNTQATLFAMSSNVAWYVCALTPQLMSTPPLSRPTSLAA